MQLATALEMLYPGAISSGRIRVVDHGEGPQVEHWDPALGAYPLQTELEAAWEQWRNGNRRAISRLEFLGRFTAGEVVFLWTQPLFAPFVARVLAAEVVDLGDATAQQARQLLAQALDAQGVPVFPDARLDAIFGTEA